MVSYAPCMRPSQTYHLRLLQPQKKVLYWESFSPSGSISMTSRTTYLFHAAKALSHVALPWTSSLSFLRLLRKAPKTTRMKIDSILLVACAQYRRQAATLGSTVRHRRQALAPSPYFHASVRDFVLNWVALGPQLQVIAIYP